MRSTSSSLVAALAFASMAPAQLTWIQRSLGPGPPTRDIVDLAYDSARKQMILLLPGATRWTTYVYDAGFATWKLQSVVSPPITGRSYVLVYDSTRQRVVFLPDGAGETWEWDGVAWIDTQVKTPKQSYRAALYDVTRRVTITFGGDPFGKNVYEWDGATWKAAPVQPPPSMAARAAAALAFDATRGVYVLFGGHDGILPLGDTWEFDGTAWQQKTPPTAPAGRWGHRMTYDTRRRLVVLHAGTTGQLDQGDVWSWNGAGWASMPSGPAPAARAGAGFEYDEHRHRAVLFGGLSSGMPRDDTWELFDPRALADYVTFGNGCAGSSGTPRIAPFAGMVPRINQQFRVDATNLPPGRTTTILVGASKDRWGSWTLPFSLTQLGMPGCTAYCSDEWAIPLSNLNGTASWVVSIPNSSALSGLLFYNQVYVADPPTNALGLVNSNAGEGLIGF